MKKSVFIAAIALFSNYASALKEVNWTIPDGNLMAVYECHKEAKKTELMRIYDSGQYEHLLYEVKGEGKEYVKRNLGSFYVKGKKITFNAPSFKSFNGKFKIGTYFRRLDLYYTAADMRNVQAHPPGYYLKDPAYWKPFFMTLETDVIVYNREAQDEIDFQSLLDYLLEGKESETDKIDAIESFIVRSIAYDYEGAKTEQPANDQYDAAAILAGPNRIAICGGYANMLMFFAEMAGIEIHEVIGHTRYDFSELSILKGYHAWNKILIDGGYELHDLTWADAGDVLNYTWINVEPTVLIGTHFPDVADDQLLAVPVSQEAFLHTACVAPYAPDAKLSHSPIHATEFVHNELRMTFAKGTRVALFTIDDAVLHRAMPYETVRKHTQLVMTPMMDYRTKIVGDSIVFTLPLISFMNVLQVEVNDLYVIRFLAVNGTEEQLLRHYAESSNAEHYEHYLKGILASIKLRDYNQLKLIAGESKSVFFDEQGKFKLKPSFKESIEQWDGSISEPIVLQNSVFEEQANGGMKERKWSSYHIEIPHGLKFTLERENGQYRIASIE